MAARDGNDQLTESELRVMIVTFIFGGMDTTRNQLGLGVHRFMDHPSQWQLLAAKPELGPAAVEEVMRVVPAVHWISRETLEEIVVGGTVVPEGTTIHLFTQSANTDPSVGGDAEFDITAARPKQLGFGAGLHHCIGHFLARADLAEAFPVLARRLRNPRPAGEATFRPENGVGGPIELPIRFDPAV